jgi:outer membrane protein OmpA-like peptidoglycan-associated protein
MKQFAAKILFLFALAGGTCAQTISFTSSSSYYYVERSNWSRYDNGSYTGLTHREARANVSAKGTNGAGVRFTGFFYVLEETLKDMTKAAQGIDDIVPVDFTVSANGHTTFARDTGFPRYRDFPVFPAADLRPGDVWQAEGVRCIDPKNNGKLTLLPIVVEYVFIGPESWKGEDAYRLKAKFATRLNKYLKPAVVDASLASATGTHDVDILISAETGAVLLILDRLDETFGYSDGSTLRFKGNTAVFTEYPPLGDRERLVADISSASGSFNAPAKDTRKAVEDTFAQSSEAKSPGTKLPPEPAPETRPDANARPDGDSISGNGKIDPTASLDDGKPFAVEDTDQGIRLSIRDLRFEADSDAILPGETWRLDAIAKTLQLAKDGNFLVEGHTASVGKPAGERELSIKRAKKVIDELAKRGIPADRFIYSGYGGTRPLADNATAAGRATNRRVEITILR